MRKLLYTLLATISLACAVPATASATFMTQAECRSALQGRPSGNDNDVADNMRRLDVSFNTGGHWGWVWGYYNRRSDNNVRQDVIVYANRPDNDYRMAFVCADSNKTGQVSSGEDYLYFTERL